MTEEIGIEAGLWSENKPHDHEADEFDFNLGCVRVCL